MSASRNADANAGQQGNDLGQFSSHVPRDEPMTTKGHKPGVLVGNDAAPEFHVQTLPPGSAPADRTFAPNSTSETPGQADNELSERSHGKESTKTDAADTLAGATSSDVHTGMGHPGQGQTSSELRDKSKQGGGLAGVGASGVSSGNMGVDPDTQPEQRAIGKEEGVMADKRGERGENPDPAAEEREPESA